MIEIESYRSLKLTRRDRALHVQFNKPETLNAVDRQTHAEIARLFPEASRDPLSDVIVLSGAGRAFSAGGDLDHIQEMIEDPSLFIGDIPEIKAIVFGLLDCPKPVIAKVNGHAIGLGATIALFCDVIFASETAKIGDPHVRMGFVAGDGGAVIWPHLIGHARAKEYLMTGRSIDAREAERIGLINHAVPSDQLDRVVDEFVDELLRGPQQAIRWTKQSVNIGLKHLAHLILDTSVAFEALSNMTSDHREAVQAFREKRDPKFTGR